MSTYATGASPHFAVRPDWLALHSEPILEPELPIVDPHHHLWDRPGSRYFGLDLLADFAGGHDVRATVAVEAGAMYRSEGSAQWRSLGETEFLNGQAAISSSGAYGDCRVAAGIVGNVDLRLGAAARPILEAHLRAAADRFRGVSFISAWHADPAAHASPAKPPAYVLGDPGFREGFAQLAPLGLSFDAWLYHTQLAELLDLARAFPQTTIVLDHVGGAIGIGPYAGRRDEVFVQWRAGIEALAGCANLCVKLGGMGMRMFGFEFGSRARPPASEELAQAWRPYVQTCIAAFGVERCMFESNFPVDKGSCSYAVLWNAFKRIAAGCSADEKRWLFAGTACKVYRLAAVGV